MGAAYFTVLAFLAPITLLICEESKMDKLTGAVAINCGALAGGDFPTAALGVIFRGLMDSSYDLLSNWIGSNVPTFLVPIAFSLVGAITSFFSSTTGVVCPALFPLIPGLSATTGLGAANLFTCTVLGAQSSAISPFSSGGSLILGSCGNEEERSSLFNRLLFVATPISIGVAAIFNLIVSMVL